MARSLNAIIKPFVRLPAPVVTRWRNRTVANADSIGFVVRKCFQCSAGKMKKLSGELEFEALLAEVRDRRAATTQAGVSASGQLL